MNFCSPFDEQLAKSGPPAVFLYDRHGDLRFDAQWTRDAYGRIDAHPEGAPCWVLLRDTATGFVQQLYITAEGLMPSHPRGEMRRFAVEAEATAAREALGPIPLRPEAW